jgi:inner membrane protein
METGGGGEFAFLLVMAGLGLVLLPLAETGRGTTGLVRAALGQLEGARAEYDRDKGAWAFAVRVKGRDNRREADISGRYAVRGPWRESGLILDTATGPRSLCPSSTCDWIATSAVLERGPAITTTAHTITAPVLDAGALRAALAPLVSASGGHVYLTGTFEAAAVTRAPPTVEVSGETVTLAYADPACLDALRGRALREVALTVQVRHAPGVHLPTLAPLADRAPVLHPLLEKWLAVPAAASEGHSP